MEPCAVLPHTTGFWSDDGTSGDRGPTCGLRIHWRGIEVAAKTLPGALDEQARLALVVQLCNVIVQAEKDGYITDSEGNRITPPETTP